MTSTADRLARQQDRERGIGTNKKAVKFLQQDYETLRQQCLKSGLLFEDEHFQAVPASLGHKELGPGSEETKGVVWKRPTELCPNPKFIVDGATRTDIHQGRLRDCWLLAAIASLTLDQDLLPRVVPQEQSFTEGYAGIFHFQFWQFGEWVDVVIDDRLPTRKVKDEKEKEKEKDELLFVHSAENLEFWSALLEKAYAKLYGSYEALSGGHTTEGFEDLTGGIAEVYTLKEAPPKLFQIMQKALSLGSLLGCGTGTDEKEKRTAVNLVHGHAYSVIRAVEVHFQGKLVQLVRMRNPFGHKEWNGPWSDKSGEWDHVSEDEKSKLNHDSDDGEFWMDYSDFIKQFSKLEICNLTPDTILSDKVGHWNHYQYEGTWRVGSTAGGCDTSSATFSSNPQFVVRLEDVDDDPLDGKDGCTFLVGLMQKERRQNKRLGRKLQSIGFYIYKVPDQCKGQSNVHLGPDDLKSYVAKSSFTNIREVCNRFNLPPGEYVIVPSNSEPDKDGSFLLRVFSEKPAAASPLEDDFDIPIEEEELSESDVDPHFKEHFKQTDGNDMEVSAFELVEILNKVVSQRSDIKTDGFSLETGRLIVSLLDKDESGKLGLMEFNLLWSKIQKYLAIFKKHDTDSSGTMNSHEMRGAATEAGFQVNSGVLQAIVSRYSDAQYAIDFDCFVGCLIKLEMLFKMFKTLERAGTGKIELDMQQWLCLAIF